MTDKSGSTTPIFRDVIRACRRRRRTLKVADSTGAELTGANLLIRALVLRRLLRRLALTPDERYVGILLPPTAAAAVTNFALSLDGRVTVNLNYSLTSEILNACIKQAGIRHVITSRRFLEKVPVQLDADLIMLEDLREAPTARDKLTAALQAHLLPVDLLLRALGANHSSPDDVMTVMFTSGTTGDPKGAMLTYANIVSNIEAVDRVIRLQSRDVLIGVLPFFHAFGYTITLWTALAFDIAVVYHVNPLDAHGVGRLARERNGTILLATPMFLRNYARRCEPEDFAMLDVVITGGERLPASVSDDFEARFGLRPVEGYGCTETSPLVAANIPPSRAVGDARLVSREGTVGKPVPGVRLKVVDPETGDELSPGNPGMLLVTGHNVMKGYLNRAEATAEAIRDDWYVTGDFAEIDADGFLRILGRESRFAKIGGEMVPHLTVEDALTTLVGLDADGGPKVVVVSTPDPTKGERLVVVHTALDHTPDQLRRGLADAGLPNLYIPAAGAFVEVDAFPTVGTGKLDLRTIKQIANESAASRSPRRAANG